MAEAGRATSPEATPQAAETPRVHTDYSLSEATSAAQLAEIVRHLKESAVRIAIYFAAAAERAPDHTISPTYEEIAQNTGLAPSAIARGLRQLCDPKTNFVTLRQGDRKTANRYKVNFLDTVRCTSFGEVLQEKYSPRPVLLLEKDCTSFGEVPPAENKRLTPGAPRLDVLHDFPIELDRVLRSKVSDFDKDSLEYFRRRLQSYMAKFGRDPADGKRYLGTTRPIPAPDNEIMARFLAVSSSDLLAQFLDELILDALKEDTRTRPEDTTGSYQPRVYGWFVRMALSHICKIHWTIQQDAERKFRLHKRGQRSPTARPAQPGQLFENPSVEEKTDTSALLKRTVAGVKNLR
jgi:hypothetical protein